MKTKIWDSVIIGAGPAGAATAITLSRFGLSVLLVEERAGSVAFKLGESLAPSAVTLLKHYWGDDLEEKYQNVFKRSMGNISIWGKEESDVSDFFFTQTGFGLCVERLAFDEIFRQKAVEAGATFIKGFRFQGCRAVSEQDFHWQIELVSQDKIQICHARYLVDCSGRKAIVAKAMNIGTSHIDNDKDMFAYAQWFSSSQNDDDSFTRIEASPFGWWYSNRLPNSDGDDAKRLVMLFSDKDLPQAVKASDNDGFLELLEQGTSHIGRFIKEKAYLPIHTIKGSPACSQKSDQFCGKNWMAVGDAAQAYDALSSQGIEKAMMTASFAGHMIYYALSDNVEGEISWDQDNQFIHRYDEQQHKLWQDYISHKDFYYQAQSLWSDQPFWARRRQSNDAKIYYNERLS